MTRNFLAILCLCFFAMAIYKAWEDQYEKSDASGRTSDATLNQTHEYWKTINADRITIDRLTTDLWERTNNPEPKTIQQQMIAVGWQPPELPSGCSNVIVSFGTTRVDYPVWLAEIPDVEIGTNDHGTNFFTSQVSQNLTLKVFDFSDSQTNKGGVTFQLTDLPSTFLADVQKSPNFSPHKRHVSFSSRFGSLQLPNGKTIDNLVFPIVISNRLFVDVDIPYLNERHRILMDTNGESAISKIPQRWDINYDSNRFEIVNEDTNPVLQVIYKSPNEVQVNGIYVVSKTGFYAAFNSPPIMASMLMGIQINSSIQPTQLVEIEDLEKMYPNISIKTDSNVLYRTKFSFAKAIFKYPSYDHNLGKLAE